ncbi:uncharacterized protein LOC142222373 [Haematobia irritans]|uniref:uncharacterized protein LOC142222373 n=1 Tax=Haematobia irritans TaxID=7368 RepID=UPI003F5065A9
MGKNKLNIAKKEKSNFDESPEKPGDIPAQTTEELNPSDLDNSSTNAFLWLMAFSVLMFTFPFLTFYGVRSWLEESFEFDTFQRNCFSVFASVLVVNFIVCLYVYKAFSEKDSSSTNPPINEKKDN